MEQKIKPIMDFITGDKFKSIADFTYAPQIKATDDYDNLQNTLDIQQLKSLNLVYTHTMYAKQLFTHIKAIQSTFIVITHNSDVCVDDSFEVPANVVKWFSTNVNTVNPKIESIPIGLENDRWFVKLHKKEKMQVLQATTRLIKNMIYMNHNIGTNPKERIRPYKLLDGREYITSDRGTNGSKFDAYIENVYTHRFVICPEGNGMDTHRMWEALYLGTIPIVRETINTKFYKNLPICIINDWDDINIKFLHSELERIQIEYPSQLLSFEYWKNKILQNYE